MIISQDQNLKEIAQRSILALVDSLNKHLEDYGKCNLQKVTNSTLEAFAKNPIGFFNEQLEKDATLKGMEGVNPEQYAKLFNYEFAPNLTKYPIDTRYLEFVKIEKGEVVVAVSLDKALADIGNVSVETPEEEAAARLLFDLFNRYTYAATLLSGGQNVITAGLERLGFSLMHQGHLSKDVVARLAVGMKSQTLEEHGKVIAVQFKNPELEEIR
jgi:hypothetical protein